jgi:hypothetical protein
MYSFFFQLGIILILILGFYSGVSGIVRTVYLLSLCVVSLLSSRVTAKCISAFYDGRTGHCLSVCRFNGNQMQKLIGTEINFAFGSHGNDEPTDSVLSVHHKINFLLLYYLFSY